MRYVDGYVVPVPRRNLKAYLRVSRKMGRLSLEHGALEYTECAADHLKKGDLAAFSRLAKLKAGETVFFSYTVYKSKADRERVSRKLREDPRVKSDLTKMPFDMTRSAYGGFKMLIDYRK